MNDYRSWIEPSIPEPRHQQEVLEEANTHCRHLWLSVEPLPQVLAGLRQGRKHRPILIVVFVIVGDPHGARW